MYLALLSQPVTLRTFHWNIPFPLGFLWKSNKQTMPVMLWQRLSTAIFLITWSTEWISVFLLKHHPILLESWILLVLVSIISFLNLYVKTFTPIPRFQVPCWGGTCCVLPDGSLCSRGGECELKKELDKRQQIESEGIPVNIVANNKKPKKPKSPKFIILSPYIPQTEGAGTGLPWYKETASVNRNYLLTSWNTW